MGIRVASADGVCPVRSLSRGWAEPWPSGAGGPPAASGVLGDGVRVGYALAPLQWCAQLVRCESTKPGFPIDPLAP